MINLLNKNKRLIKTICLVVVALFFVIASSCIWLNRARYLVLNSERLSITKIDKEFGYEYSATIKPCDQRYEYSPTRAIVIEDGKALDGYQNAIHEHLRNVGKGSAFFYSCVVYFSTSDNSDPRYNGRKYEVEYPKIIRYYIAYPTYVLTLLLLVFLIKCTLRNKNWQRKFQLVDIQANEKYSKKIVRYIIVTCVTTVMLLILVFLNSMGVIVFKKSILPLNDISNISGFAYCSDRGLLDIDSEKYLIQIEVLENGQPLVGASKDVYENVVKYGKGLYSFQYGNLYFSTSDNSDPRTNGRTYSLRYQLTFGKIKEPLIYFTALMLIILGFICLVNLYRTSKFQNVLIVAYKYQYLICGSLLVISYILPRLNWIVNYRVALLAIDSPSYFAPLQEYLQGKLPNFYVRTAGYPVFLFLVLSIYKSVTAVVFTQTILTLLSAVFLLRTVHTTIPSLTYVAGLSMVAHVAQPFVVMSDFLVLTESLFASCLITLIGVLFKVATNNDVRKIWLLFLSILLASLILIRPNALFYVFIYVLVILFLCVKSRLTKNAMAFVLPMPLILFGMLTYNYYSFGKFSLSLLGNATMFSVTSYMWEPSVQYSPEVNKEIILKFKGLITSPDYKIIEKSWDPNEFTKTTVPYINRAFYGDSVYIADRNILKENAPNGEAYLHVDALMGKIAVNAIKHHPMLYFRFVVFNLYTYFLGSNVWRVDLNRDMPNLLQYMYIDGLVTNKAFNRFVDTAIPSWLITKKVGNEELVVVKPTALTVLSNIFLFVLRRIFDSWIWTWMFTISWLYSLWTLFKSRMKDQDAFLLFTISSLLLLTALSFSMVTPISNRYPSPTQFIEIFSVMYFFKIKCASIFTRS